MTGRRIIGVASAALLSSVGALGAFLAINRGADDMRTSAGRCLGDDGAGAGAFVKIPGGGFIAGAGGLYPEERPAPQGVRLPVPPPGA